MGALSRQENPAICCLEVDLEPMTEEGIQLAARQWGYGMSWVLCSGSSHSWEGRHYGITMTNADFASELDYMDCLPVACS